MTTTPIWVPGNEVVQRGSDNTYRWATVTQLSPLRIRLDGDTSALSVTPESLISPASLTVGGRVWVQMFARRLLILGASSGGDTGWVNVTITDATNFGLYEASEPIRVRRIGNMVWLKGGLLSKTAGFIDGASNRVWGQLPVGFYPTPVASGTTGSEPSFVSQASSLNRYELRVWSDGRLTAERHGPGSSNANTWCNVNAHWLTN